MHAELTSAVPTEKADNFFMRAALYEAAQAESMGEVPVGAVLVHDDVIVSRAHNAPITLQDPTAHAEVLVLRIAARQLANYRLSGTTVYVTAEPCLMCAGALIHARVKRVVFGCRDAKAGAFGSAFDVGRDTRSNHRLEICGGVCAQEASAMLQQFFRDRRGA